MKKYLLAALMALAGSVFASQNATVLPTTGTVTGLQMTQNINNAIDTVASLYSGSTNPGAVGAYRLWADTGTNTLQQRNAANTGWTSIAPLLTSLAPTASPAFTGAPTAPTAGAGSNTTQIATTAFVTTNFAPLASPSLTGTPIAPTPSTADSSTKVATTAYVQNQGYATTSALATKSAQFTGSASTSGYIKDPTTGIIIQWGRINKTTNTPTITQSFPIAFPNAVFSVTSGMYTGGNSVNFFNAVYSFTNSQITIRSDNFASWYWETWVAVGN